MGTSSLNLMLISVVWVMVGAEVVVPIGTAIPIPITIAAAPYAAYQYLQASFTKDCSYISIVPILYYT